MFEATDLLRVMAPSYYVYNTLLTILVLLDAAWFYYIGRAACLAILYGQVCKTCLHLDDSGKPIRDIYFLSGCCYIYPFCPLLSGPIASSCHSLEDFKCTLTLWEV